MAGIVTTISSCISIGHGLGLDGTLIGMYNQRSRINLSVRSGLPVRYRKETATAALLVLKVMQKYIVL